MAKSAVPTIIALVGSDPFLQTEELHDILSKLKDAQRSDFEGDKAPLATVLDELRSFSMFGGSKLVIVRDADEFISRYREKLEAFITAVGESSETVTGTLVLRLSSLPANQRIYKAIAKAGEVRKCEPPRDAELPAWLVKRAKAEHQTTIEPSAAKALAELIGNDLGRLDSELAKLAIVADQSAINTTHVAASVSFQREQEIKEVTALLGRGRPEEAVRKWRLLTQSDTSAEFRAITWLGIWLEKTKQALALKAQGVPPQAMGKTLWIHDPQELKDFLATATKLGPAGVTRQLIRLTDIDRRVKSGLGDAADNIERFLATALTE